MAIGVFEFLTMPLTGREIQDLLSKPLLAHLAIERTDGPHVSPVWVLYYDGVFYFTTRTRRVKGAAIKGNSKVAVSIATDTIPYLAVVIKGRAEIVEDDKARYLGEFVSKYVSPRVGKKNGERFLEELKGEPDRIVFKVCPMRLLSWNYGRGDYQRQNEGNSMSTMT